MVGRVGMQRCNNAAGLVVDIAVVDHDPVKGRSRLPRRVEKVELQEPGGMIMIISLGNDKSQWNW